MKDYTKYIIGFLLIFIGLILGLNAFGITNINLFFSGWWTLFIIIPSFSSACMSSLPPFFF